VLSRGTSHSSDILSCPVDFISHLTTASTSWRAADLPQSNPSSYDSKYISFDISGSFYAFSDRSDISQRFKMESEVSPYARRRWPLNSLPVVFRVSSTCSAGEITSAGKPALFEIEIPCDSHEAPGRIRCVHIHSCCTLIPYVLPAESEISPWITLDAPCTNGIWNGRTLDSHTNSFRPW
jgi:hypothetical protein